MPKYKKKQQISSCSEGKGFALAIKDNQVGCGSRGGILVKEAINPSVLKIVRHILGYLLERSEAKDTVEGVLHWWLPKGGGETHSNDVQLALDWLVVRGWVIERTPSQSLFGLNKERRVEIEQFLMSWEKQDNVTDSQSAEKNMGESTVSKKAIF
jgi:hypothetical protein